MPQKSLTGSGRSCISSRCGELDQILGKPKLFTLEIISKEKSSYEYGHTHAQVINIKLYVLPKMNSNCAIVSKILGIYGAIV